MNYKNIFRVKIELISSMESVFVSEADQCHQFLSLLSTQRQAFKILIWYFYTDKNLSLYLPVIISKWRQRDLVTVKVFPVSVAEFNLEK